MDELQITDLLTRAQDDLHTPGKVLAAASVISAVVLAFAAGAAISYDRTSVAYLKSLNETIPDSE